MVVCHPDRSGNNLAENKVSRTQGLWHSASTKRERGGLDQADIARPSSDGMDCDDMLGPSHQIAALL